MDADLETRLTNIEKMVSDNNRMLVKMRKAQKKAASWRVIYWVIIIGLTVASFYFIKPYFGQLGSLTGLGSSTSTTAPTTSTSSLTNLLNQYEASQNTK